MAKVLLVEDDNNLREIYEARLAAEGYEISSAQDGEEALVVAKQTKPDLVVSDVMMPKISGFEMLDILRNTPGLEHVKVIMLTALGQSEDRDRADSLGADKYLVKSQVTLEDIVKTAHELLGDGEPEAPAAAETAVTPPTETAPPVATEPVTPAAVAAPALAVEPAPEAAPVDQPVSAPAEPIASTVPAPATDNLASNVTDDALAEAAAELTASAPDTDTPPADEPAPVSPAASDQLAGSTAQEQADVSEQINNFVQTTPADPEPVQPAPTDSEAAALPVADPADATTADDQLMADAAAELASSTDTDASAPAMTNPTETPTTETPPVTPEVAAQPSEDVTDSNEAAEKTTIAISGKKVIQPLDSEPKPDINELLAREEAAAGNPVTGAAVIAGSEAGEDAPQQTEITDTPAIVHQPGQSFAPQPQTDDETATSTASAEDMPSGSPAPAPSEKDGFDPNSVAL